MIRPLFLGCSACRSHCELSGNEKEKKVELIIDNLNCRMWNIVYSCI